MYALMSTSAEIYDGVESFVGSTLTIIKVLVGFSFIIFIHELGHFLAAKYVGIRVDRFAIGFGYRLFGWRRGEGFTLGRRPNYSADALRENRFGETDYCLNVLPLGGYVKMLGQDDIIIDDKTNEMRMGTDPRAFNNRPVGARMLVVSAGVVFNLLFAAVLLMCVFLVGKEMVAPVVGPIQADSPAMRAGLRSGDRILAIDNKEVRSFMDIVTSTVLSESPLRFKVQRGAEVLPEEFVIEPERIGTRKERTIGVFPAYTNELIDDGPRVGDLPAPKAGDRVLAVEDRPVSDGTDVLLAFLASEGRPLKLTVERKDKKHPRAQPQKLDTWQRATLMFGPADFGANPAQRVNEHLLGMLRRRTVLKAQPGGAAERAGIMPGDVIVQWGTVGSPLFPEITDAIKQGGGKPTPVIVERDGKLVSLTVTPQRKFSLFGTNPLQAGLDFGPGAEEDKPVVADVYPGTPAAKLNLPRGTLILAIDDQPVKTWHDVVRLLQQAAGRSVVLRYRTGAEEAAGTLQVPSSIFNELNLPVGANIRSVDGKDAVTLESGETLRLPAATVLRKLLEERVGQTVTIKYTDNALAPTVHTKSFAVRPDNTDPWQMRIQYQYAEGFKAAMALVTAQGNPLKAMQMGIEYTWDTVTQVFQIMKQLAKQNVSPENVAGPIGIISVAVDRANEGWGELLFFLAFLSANLAVINFLPLPVMDGGLMVFLLIEKFKGRPLSLKTQMISTLVGLAVIVLCFVFVIVQDVTRLFNPS